MKRNKKTHLARISRVLALLILCLNALQSAGQNLIADPSFEEIPCHGKGVSTSPNWFYLKTQVMGVYNECNPQPFLRPSFKTVNQYPKFGSAFAGSLVIISEFEPMANYTNPIAILKETLNKGHVYYLSFFTSLRKSTPLALKEYGANFLDYFPDTTVHYRDQPFFGQHDWENSNGLLDDTIGWEKVGGLYKSKGGEFVVTFGCMLPFEKVTIKKLREKEFISSQYFLDGFTLIPYPELPKDTVLCEGDTLRLTPKTPDGSFYQWSTGQIGGTLNVTKPGWYWAMNYSDFDTIYDSIRVDFFPLKAQRPQLALCGDQAVLDINLSNIYESPFENVEWRDGIKGSKRPLTQAGIYPFRAATGACVLRDTISVSLSPSPQPISSTLNLCENRPLWLTAGTNIYDSVQWNGRPSDSFLLDQSGLVKRQVFSKNCLFYDSTQVTIWPDIRYADIDTPWCSGAPFDLIFDTLNVRYQSFEKLEIREYGTYTLQYYGACDTQQLKINVIEETDCNCPIFIPNAITPNGNDINDTFKIFTECAIETQLFRVFNRWGQLLYESNKSTLWQGEHSEQDDTYMNTYFFTWSAILNKNGKQHKIYRKGHIALLR